MPTAAVWIGFVYNAAATKWVTIGTVPGWKRWEWPIPDFARNHGRKTVRTRYPNSEMSERPELESLPAADVPALLSEGWSGALYVENVMADYFAGEDNPNQRQIRSVDWPSVIADAQSRAPRTEAPPMVSGASNEANQEPDEAPHAVLLFIPAPGDGESDLFESLDMALEGVTSDDPKIEYDGYERGDSMTFFIYTSDIDATLTRVREALKPFDIPADARALTRERIGEREREQTIAL